jgi:Bacteriophage protein GP30.3
LVVLQSYTFASCLNKIGFMTNTIDIKAKAPFPAGALRNFCPHRFELDGVICGSMEGLLQGLKVKDLAEQERLCALSVHSIGGDDPTETILTLAESCGRLERLRGRRDTRRFGSVGRGPRPGDRQILNAPPPLMLAYWSHVPRQS